MTAPFCSLVCESDGVWRCGVCGFGAPAEVQHVCGTRGPASYAHLRRPVPGSVVSAAIDFARASAEWAAAGFPTRDADSIRAIYETHCRPCPNFVPDPYGRTEGTCRLCSCRLSPTFHIVLEPRNAIGWATKGCPDVPPRWLAGAQAPGPVDCPTCPESATP